MDVTGITPFDPGDTLMCGQAFRWEKIEENTYTGIAHGRRLTICKKGDTLSLHDTCPEEYERVWQAYFGLDMDYEKVQAQLVQYGGGHMRAAISYAPGLRVMRQNHWEALISFILSQNANIPRIRKMVEALCGLAGEKLPCGGYTFPAPEALAKLSEADLAPVRAGYRAKYILSAAEYAASGLPISESSLTAINGVGPKVAACALLYGYGRHNIMPMDVWMRRAMAQFYPLGLPREISHIAGIAQQYLFHYIRSSSLD